VPTNVVIPITEGITTTACSDGSDKTNDQICTAEQTNQQEKTVVQQQNTVTPQVTQPVHTENLENSSNTISTQDNDINDLSSSGTSSNSHSDNQDSTSNEDNLFFPDKNDYGLSDNSRFIIMQQDNGQTIGLFQIISNENNMSVNVLP
jgi:hypothetical protein